MTDESADTGIAELEGCYVFNENDGWRQIKQIKPDGEELNFVMKPVTAESVPLS